MRACYRFAVSTHTAGLSDNLVGGVSAFYFAVLTGRAFQWGFTSRGGDQSEGADYNLAYDQPNINWTFPGLLQGHDITVPTGPARDAPPDKFRGFDHDKTFLINDLSWYLPRNDSHQWKYGNVTAFGEGFETVVFTNAQVKGVALLLDHALLPVLTCPVCYSCSFVMHHGQR